MVQKKIGYCYKSYIFYIIMTFDLTPYSFSDKIFASSKTHGASAGGMLEQGCI